MTSTASILVAVVTLLNIAGLLWLLWWTRKRDDVSQAAQTTGHVWDENLTELNNPLPRWWLGLFLLTAVFGLGYLVFYPGLGNFSGTRGWTQVEQYRAQSREAEAVLTKTLAPFASMPVDGLVADPAALRVGRNLFVSNCATCHGSDGRGAPGFPNLADKDWLWGGGSAAVLESIQHGRTGVMMAWEPVIGDVSVENLVSYVLSLSGRKLPAGDAIAGKAKFEEVCSACHGMNATGNLQIGAPNLADSIWVYGGSIAAVRASIAHGRQGQMPEHLTRLGETRTKLLAAYVLSFNAGSP